MPDKKSAETGTGKSLGAAARGQAIADVVKAADAQLTEQERAMLEQIRNRITSKLTPQQVAIADGCGCIFW